MKIRPNKKLGQNFLVDPVIIERIIASTGFCPQDTVLEIGAGLGALTLPLSKSVGRVVAVEKDRRLVDSLKGELKRLKISDVTLVQEDILSFDFAGIQPAPPGKIQVAGKSAVQHLLTGIEKTDGKSGICFESRVDVSIGGCQTFNRRTRQPGLRRHDPLNTV